MAQQTLRDDVEWKPGTKCDLYDRDNFKWVEGEVIGSFSKDNREWITVRCGQSERNVFKGDPELRKRALISGDQLKQLQDAATQIPNIAPILESILPSSREQGLYAHSDGLLFIFYILSSIMLYILSSITLYIFYTIFI